MKVTYEEFCKDPMKYLTLAETEEILLERDGGIFIHMYNPNAERLKAARSLFGILKGQESLVDEIVNK